MAVILPSPPVKNEDFCIKNEEMCIQMMKLVSKMMKFAAESSLTSERECIVRFVE